MESPTDQLEQFAKEHPAGRLKLLVKRFGVFPFALVLLLLVGTPMAVYMYLQDNIERRMSAEYQQAALAAQRLLLYRSRDTVLAIYSEISDLRLTLANPEKPLDRDDLLRRVDRLQSAADQLREELTLSPRSETSPFRLVGAAQAQPVTSPAAQPTAPSKRISEDMRTWIMVLVFIVLGITFIISIVAIFKTTNAEVLRFAFDTVKTLLGFFIGVATTLIGTS